MTEQDGKPMVISDCHFEGAINLDDVRQFVIYKNVTYTPEEYAKLVASEERKPFADALGDLLAEYADLGTEALLDDMERHVESLEDQFKLENPDNG